MLAAVEMADNVMSVLMNRTSSAERVLDGHLTFPVQLTPFQIQK